MDGEGWVSFISFLAIVFTVAMFSSGIYTCYKIHVSKSTGVIPHLPFVSGLLNCALWLTYGCYKEDSTVVIVNLIGFLLFASYTMIYFVYTTDKMILYNFCMCGMPNVGVICLVGKATAIIESEIKMHTGIALIFIATVIVYCYYVTSDHDTALFHLGLLSNFFTVMFFASPLSTMAEVFRTKTTESMSFSLSLLSLIVTALWVYYSYLVQDVFIKIPNSIGFILALVQLVLFGLYWNNKSRKVISLELPVV